jgi:drug/metabolite transporter (DMT)-like permease
VQSRIRWLWRSLIIAIGVVVAFAGYAGSAFQDEYGDGDMTVPGITMAIGAVVIVAGLALGWRREPKPTDKERIASR